MKPGICLECGSFIEAGSSRVLKDESGEATKLQCPICFEERQIVSVEEILKTNTVRNAVIQLEVRYPSERGGRHD